MSVKVTSWVWDLPISPTQKLVLLALADHADDEGKCWPGVNGIAQKCRIHRTTVFSVLKVLEELNLIFREGRRGSKGYQSSNTYILNINNEVFPESRTATLDSVAQGYSGQYLYGNKTIKNGQKVLSSVAVHYPNHHAKEDIYININQEKSSVAENYPGKNGQVAIKKEKKIKPNEEENFKPELIAYFDELWGLYLRKEKKKRSKVYFCKKIKPNAELFLKIKNAVISHTEIHKKKQTPIKYIPYFSTWLNDESWNDEIHEEDKKHENNRRNFETSGEKLQRLYDGDFGESTQPNIYDHEN